MNQKNTPGPWALGGPEGDNSGAQGYVYCDNSAGSAVAICFGEKLKFPLFSREEEIANARLIAAAPDLLAALQHVYNNISNDAPHGVDMDIVHAAVAKALVGAS